MLVAWAGVAAAPVLVGAYLGPAYAAQGAACAGIFCSCERYGLVGRVFGAALGCCIWSWCVFGPRGGQVDGFCGACAYCEEVGGASGVYFGGGDLVIREWMAALGKRDDVKVGFVRKIKTAVQMTPLTMLLAVSELSSAFATGGVVLLAASAVLALYSGLGYARAALPSLQSGAL